MEKEERKSHGMCLSTIQHVADALYILNGKWKLPILVALRFGDKRFGQMTKEIPKITEKMLSKELRELEANLLVKRTVFDSLPVVIEYSLTKYGRSLDTVINELATWGKEHRKKLRSN